MEAKKLLTIALTGLLAGGCLMVPALAEDADGRAAGIRRHTRFRRG